MAGGTVGRDGAEREALGEFDAEVQRLVENGSEVVEVPRRDRDCTGSEQSAAWARAVAQRAKERRGLTMEFRDANDTEKQ